MERADLANLIPGISPSPGTPGEGRGEGLQTARANRNAALTLALSRSTRRGDQRRRFRRAFTLAELLIGLAVSAIVLSALAAATYAVAQCWESDDGTQQLAIQSDQIALRVKHYLSTAKYIGLVELGSLDGSAHNPGCVFYWANDNWNGVSDTGPQIGEMALIEHDPSTGSLWLYQAIPQAQMNSTQLASAGGSITWSEMNDTDWAANFAASFGINPPYVTKTPIGSSVKGAMFAVNWLGSTTQRPFVEATLVLNRSPQPAVTQYAGVLLRAPVTQPSP